MVDDNNMEDRRGKEGDEGLIADVTNGCCSVSIATASSAVNYVSTVTNWLICITVQYCNIL